MSAFGSLLLKKWTVKPFRIDLTPVWLIFVAVTEPSRRSEVPTGNLARIALIAVTRASSSAEIAEALASSASVARLVSLVIAETLASSAAVALLVSLVMSVFKPESVVPASLALLEAMSVSFLCASDSAFVALVCAFVASVCASVIRPSYAMTSLRYCSICAL